MAKRKRTQIDYQRNNSHGSSLDRDLTILKEHLPKSLGGDGLTAEAIGQKHGLTKRGVYKVLNKKDIKATREAWTLEMRERIYKLGPLAVDSLAHLLKIADPVTVNNYLKGTGVYEREQVVSADIEELNINAPPEVLELVRKIAGGTSEQDTGTEPADL